MYDLIGEKVSSYLEVDITQINDIDLIEEPFYLVVVDGESYTYNTQTEVLELGVLTPSIDNKLTDAEKEKLAEEDMALIHFVLKGINKGQISYDELYSVGSLGFAKALNSYRKNRGTKFSTFAVFCIKNEVLFYLKKEQKHIANTISLNQSLSRDGDGHDLVLEDLLSEEDIGKQTLEEIFQNKELRSFLLKLIDRLSDEEKTIMLNRYGILGYKKTQQELAKELDMTQANVSKIQQNCLRKLLIYMKVEDLKS